MCCGFDEMFLTVFLGVSLLVGMVSDALHSGLVCYWILCVTLLYVGFATVWVACGLLVIVF